MYEGREIRWKHVIRTKIRVIGMNEQATVISKLHLAEEKERQRFDTEK